MRSLLVTRSRFNIQVNIFSLISCFDRVREHYRVSSVLVFGDLSEWIILDFVSVLQKSTVIAWS